MELVTRAAINATYNKVAINILKISFDSFRKRAAPVSDVVSLFLMKTDKHNLSTDSPRMFIVM